MAILKIARMGHPVLRRRADTVADPTAPRIHALIRNMIETMRDADGAGLAAPQVHVPLRVVIFHVPPGRDEEDYSADADSPETDDGDFDDEEPGDGESGPLTVLINPEIEPLTDETTLGWEGCLSLPGLIGAVPRFSKIRYSGLGPDGEQIERVAEGFHARVVQHECDHLDGMLYPQRMTDLSLLMFQEELKHGMPEAMRNVMDEIGPEAGEELAPPPESEVA